MPLFKNYLPWKITIEPENATIMTFLFQAPIFEVNQPFLSSSRVFFIFFIIFRAAKVLVSANFLGSLLVIIRACSSKLALRHKLSDGPFVTLVFCPLKKVMWFHRGVLPGIKSVGGKFELYL